ncbi:hypothetical protein HPB50_009332 [Hyalomma asiaticum]|uniref:Uncharacterized protein n=1 Tax=Hyalomma asiaticum TaxID=266040 RepID=A0ACB7S1B6_HYAAI|nr:hypothetical protein HPB50_009332 [Hyalomma asiaticum]
MGRADELKLEIEALKLQLEVEKLKTARFLQKAVQARSETSGLGRYAKDLKAVLVPMPADDTMVPAWFKMAEMLLKMLGVPEEMQGTLVLPFLTEKVRTSLSGTCSYEELKEKVLRELRLTPTEYRRCFLETKKEVREQSCDRTKLTGSFGKAVTTEVARVPVGLPCPSENTRRVSLPVSRELATNADVLMTPGDHDNHCLAMSRSEPKLEGSVCGLVERSAEQAVILANGNGVDTATPFCEEEIARDAVREEPNKGDEDDVCSEATLESAHEREVSRDNKISEQEADPVSGGREQASIAKVGAAGDPAQRPQNTASESDKRTKRTQAGLPSLAPLLYMVYAAGLKQAFLKSRIGFAFHLMSGGEACTWTLPGLVFADDLVLLAEQSSDLQSLVNIAANHLERLGLHFNDKKSAILRFSGTEVDIDVQLPGGGNIPVLSEYTYLEVNLHSSVDVFSRQEEHVRQASVRATSVLRRHSLRGCNRSLLVQELWKKVHMSVLIPANAIICLSTATHQWLEGVSAKRDGQRCHAMGVWLWKISKATWDDTATRPGRRVAKLHIRAISAS